MYELLKLQAEAWKENNYNGKTWAFHWDGRNGSVKIMVNKKGVAGYKDGTFFTDDKGMKAACKFISENLIQK